MHALLIFKEKAVDKKQSVLKNFLTYIKIDTQSDDTSETVPSTAKQLNLAKVLIEEINALGITEVELDDKGYIYGKIRGNIDAKVPTIGFIAHMDTALEFPYPGDEARVIDNYDGEPVTLCEGVVLDPANNPPLMNAKGKTIVVTNGKTLLGGDDKAGVAEIMTALEYMVKTPEFRHGDIAFSFTPDEEIGTSVDHFDVKKLAADRAYTLDGAAPDEISYENFNAASASIKIHGIVTHPGEAKNKMKNALHVACEFAEALPASERPEHTEGYEGFYHLMEMNGNCEEAILEYIIRDHDIDKLEQRKALMSKCAEFLNEKYGADTVEISFKDSYRNMAECMKGHEEHIEYAMEAIREQGLDARPAPMRGGTDGAGISRMGVPCPNLGTGSYNHHGNREYAVVEEMVMLVDIMLSVISKYAKEVR